jgi:glycosyltransferase involved in cell wall biosynthesis
MATPLKLAVVSDSVPPFFKGGKETRIYHLTHELSRLGCDVHIYTMHWWKDDGDYEEDGITYHAISKLYPLYAGERRSIKEGLLFGLACLKLWKYDTDMYEVDHMPFFPLFSVKLISLLKRKPMFAIWHEVWGKKYWQEYLGGISGTIAYLIERASVHMPSHIVAVSDHTAGRLRSELHYKGPLSMVTNGINTDDIQPIKAAKRRSDVVYTGRLLAHKNVDLLIEAIAILKQTQPKISCLIIGEGPEKARLEKLIVDLNVSDNVSMLGYVESSADVFGLMKSSRVFVLPSVREGFGITVLEAYACGLSIVTVDHRDNAAQYVAPKDCSIVCSTTAADIASSISTLLQRQTASAAGHDASVYDWKVLGQRLKGIYSS